MTAMAMSYPEDGISLYSLYPLVPTVLPPALLQNSPGPTGLAKVFCLGPITPQSLILNTSGSYGSLLGQVSIAGKAAMAEAEWCTSPWYKHSYLEGNFPACAFAKTVGVNCHIGPVTNHMFLIMSWMSGLNSSPTKQASYPTRRQLIIPKTFMSLLYQGSQRCDGQICIVACKVYGVGLIHNQQVVGNPPKHSCHCGEIPVPTSIHTVQYCSLHHLNLNNSSPPKTCIAPPVTKKILKKYCHTKRQLMQEHWRKTFCKIISDIHLRLQIYYHI